jgi:hypothetical protein
LGGVDLGVTSVGRPDLDYRLPGGQTISQMLDAQVSQRLNDYYPQLISVANMAAAAPAAPSGPVPVVAPPPPAFETIVSRTPLPGVTGGRDTSPVNLGTFSPLGSEGPGGERSLV